MKNIFKSIIVFILSLFARAVVRRYRPHIVMVTGSVGKTSTKDAVATVLATRFLVRKSDKSFNSGFGVPFTILGVDNPWQNPLAWLSIFRRAFVLLFLPNHYPKMLVLEVGADRPGDLAKILRIAKPDAVVVTRLPEIPVHVEAYTSPEAVREEEFSPAYALSAAAPLIIPADDRYALESSVRTPARILSYGVAPTAMVQVSEIGFFELEGKVEGMRATVTIQGQRENLIVRGSVGTTQILPAAAALTVALAFDIPIETALTALESYKPPRGRGRLLVGKNNSVLIDDSYNSSPVAVEQALATLKAFPNKARRIAVLGDMLELGRYSVSEHERIARVAQESADVIIAVGIRARAFALPEGRAKVLLFDTARDAIEALLAMVQDTDVVLIKGSQSIRTEHIVKALLANPDDVTQLVRQEGGWRKRS